MRSAPEENRRREPRIHCIIRVPSCVKKHRPATASEVGLDGPLAAERIPRRCMLTRRYTDFDSIDGRREISAAIFN